RLTSLLSACALLVTDPLLSTSTAAPAGIDGTFPLSRVDPGFNPEVGVATSPFLAGMPDGRILISESGNGMAVLLPDGGIDPSFALTFPAAPVHIFPDGSILARPSIQIPTRGTQYELVRLSGDGSLEQRLAVAPGFPSAPVFVAAQPDKKILLYFDSAKVGEEGTLARLGQDGTLDASFKRIATYWPAVAVQADGRLLVASSWNSDLPDDAPREKPLLRLHSDGSHDDTFSVVLARTSAIPVQVEQILLRRSGKILIQGSFDVVNGTPMGSPAQLNPDGSLDLGFQMAGLPEIAVGYMPGLREHSGEILLTGPFQRIDGLARNLVRLRNSQPQPEFRVHAQPPYRRGSLASLELVRTGERSSSASVVLQTDDGTANSPRDYGAFKGTIHFAAGEAVQKVGIPIYPNDTVLDRVSFRVLLSDPSQGYAATGPVTITVLPDRVAPLWLATGGVYSYPETNYVVLVLQGVVPGIRYDFESSTDFRAWQPFANATASGKSLILPAAVPTSSSGFSATRFFRARPW
ncbi:MAG: hypothetical protein L6Q38_20010, partial [Nitrospira sp.]|nr:hypothetical protein [Nitrospira sp.]